MHQFYQVIVPILSSLQVVGLICTHLPSCCMVNVIYSYLNNKQVQCLTFNCCPRDQVQKATHISEPSTLQPYISITSLNMRHVWIQLVAIGVSTKPTAQAPYPPPNTLVAQPPTTRLTAMAKLGCSPCSWPQGQWRLFNWVHTSRETRKYDQCYNSRRASLLQK